MRRSEAKPAAEPKKRTRAKCSAKGFCDGLVRVCGLGNQKGRGGLEISIAFSRPLGGPKMLVPRTRAIVRQAGVKYDG